MEADPVALTSLLRVLVLRAAPPPALGGPTDARACVRGAGGGTAMGAAPGVPRATAGPPGRTLPCASAPAPGPAWCMTT
jgi:hypothetical protein